MSIINTFMAVSWRKVRYLPCEGTKSVFRGVNLCAGSFFISMTIADFQLINQFCSKRAGFSLFFLNKFKNISAQMFQLLTLHPVISIRLKNWFLGLSAKSFQKKISVGCHGDLEETDLNTDLVGNRSTPNFIWLVRLVRLKVGLLHLSQRRIKRRVQS